MQGLTWKNGADGQHPLLDHFSSLTLRNNLSREDYDKQTRCNGSKDEMTAFRPKKIQLQTLVWQNTSAATGNGSGNHDAYVFSAFYDARWSPPIVLIVGIATNYHNGGKRRRFCRMWFEDDDEPRVTAAHFRFVPETHSRK